MTPGSTRGTAALTADGHGPPAGACWTSRRSAAPAVLMPSEPLPSPRHRSARAKERTGCQLPPSVSVDAVTVALIVLTCTEFAFVFAARFSAETVQPCRHAEGSANS